MNIIRTKVVELSTIEGFAYKQKLSSGGAGIKILLNDGRSAVCTIDKRSSEMVPYGTFDDSLFPMDAFDEAFELTNSLPYSSRGNVKLLEVEEVQPDDVLEDAAEDQVDMTLSLEYQAIVDRYSDEKGKLNYVLMNKDFMQFASRSKAVSMLVSNGASQQEILELVVKNRAMEISNQKESLSEESVKLLIETLDEIDPRSAFKELKAYITRLSAKNKRK